MTGPPGTSALAPVPDGGAGHGASPVTDPQALLAPEHVAAALAISRSYVFRLMRTGQLPFVRVGRFYRVTAEDLRAFVAAHRSVSPAPGDGLRVRVRARWPDPALLERPSEADRRAGRAERR